MYVDELYQIFLRSAGVSIDTRTLKAGQIFFGLQGEKYDGGVFAEEALRKGALAVVISDKLEEEGSPYVFRVEDPLQTLQDLARHHRRQCTQSLFIAVAGSNGKTTTKELIGRILQTQTRTYISPGNWNNHIGLPLAVLGVRSFHKYVVLEIGDNHPGEVEFLCHIARPHIGVLTNMGKDHLGFFQDMETNLQTKWEIVTFLSQQHDLHPRKFFYNAEEPLFQQMPLPPHVEAIPFGEGTAYQGAWEALSWTQATLHARIHDSPVDFNVSLWGSHNRLNLLGAIAVCHTLGVSFSDIQRAVRAFRPVFNRSQYLYLHGKHIILDAYNANPSSMQSSIESFFQLLQPSDIPLLILGQMEELGAHTDQEHLNLVRWINDLFQGRTFSLIGIGPQWEKWIPASQATHTASYPVIQAILQSPPDFLFESSPIFLKGSRKYELEKLIRLF
ncbi:MAG: UDP-N-acetylmuramoyl-tripeptide--D-alanyl-D-alanine ligase [Bacteroidia bacterium]